ncbi:WD repeat-containing protein 19 [Aphelenchoides besseyi]|nr:WD repeat-containing protein 19 [Aphelenchoides besseyi]
MKLLFKETDPSVTGEGPVVFEWRPGGNHIAIGGSTGVVCIYDRYGAKAEEMRLGSKIDRLRWERNGEVLAIVSSQVSVVTLFELATRQIIPLDVAMGTKGLPTFAEWSTDKPVLIIGNNHGNILLFNYRTSRKIPLIGKHQRSIITGAFNSDIFALGSDDMTVTVNNLEGETIATISSTAEPSVLKLIRFHRADVQSDQPEIFLSFVAGRRTLSVASIADTNNPISLQFQDKYGHIVDTAWYGNGMVVIGFEHGFLVVLSAQNWNEVNHELFSVQEFHNTISYICLNTDVGKLFTAGDNGQIKIRNLDELQELSDIIESSSDAKAVTRIQCTEDGTLTAVSTESPALSVYLTKIPVRAAAYRNRVMILSSLTEILVYEDGNTHNPISFNAKLEPSIISIGLKHIAVAFNNRVWFYELRKNAVTFLFEQEYITTINGMKMNRDFVMIEMERGVLLHSIKPENENKRRMFPEEGKSSERLEKADLLEKFLVYSTDKHRIRYFSLVDWAYASDFKHNRAITALFGEPNGIRSVFFDEYYNAFLYHPADDDAYAFPEMQTASSYKTCLWETFTVDKDSLLLADVAAAYVYVTSRNRQLLNHIGTLKIPYGNIPLSLSKGIVYCHTANGKLNTMLLSSHKTDITVEGKTREQLFESLEQSVKLKRWRNGWKLCDRMNDESAWNVLATAAMRDLNLELAIRIYRHVGKVSMVLALESLRGIEEENLLSGHVLSMLGEFDKADELFCLSSEPNRALEMRRNILDWDRALKLAQEIAQDQQPYVSLEYATQLEFTGQHAEALHYYEQALLTENDENLEEVEEHNIACRSGIARMCLKTGDIQRGVQLAIEVPGRLIKRDCGVILEQTKLFNEAARVYEAGEFYDRAAAAFIRAKNWVRIVQIEENIRSPKVLSQYGKLLLADKKYEQAYQMFERARNYDQMISVLLKNLNRADEAVRIARECRSAEGARLVAMFFTDIGNETSAIEFLVLSQCYQEAYDMALGCQKMNVYATALEETGSQQQFVQIAEYFSTIQDHAEAGKFYGLAKDYDTAINHLLQAGDNDAAILNAIEFTAQSSSSILVDKLVHFLMGESDGIPKDPKYLFQMYTRMGMHAKAAKIAMIIAQEQQSRGSYRTAHQLLFSMRQSLKSQKIYVPTELEDWLMILHSYIIVKKHVTSGNDMTAARLLIRVTTNISRFPQHEIEIMTSTVITCAKAGLRETAFKLAVRLLQGRNKDKMDKKYRRKLETIVRKADNVSDKPEVMTACPECATDTREFDLACAGCKSTIPYCIVTGKHIIANDFAVCASCGMPGFYSEFQQLSNNNEPCPMCGKLLSNPVSANGAEYMARVNEKQQ